MTESQKEKLFEIWDDFMERAFSAYEKAEKAAKNAEKLGTEKAKRKAKELERESEERTFITGELQAAFVDILEVLGYSVEKNEIDEIVDITQNDSKTTSCKSKAPPGRATRQRRVTSALPRPAPE